MITTGFTEIVFEYHQEGEKKNIALTFADITFGDDIYLNTNKIVSSEEVDFPKLTNFIFERLTVESLERFKKEIGGKEKFAYLFSGPGHIASILGRLKGIQSEGNVAESGAGREQKKTN